MIAGDPATHHLVALAAGRAALFGAVTDALLAERGVGSTTVDVGPATSPSAGQRPKLEGLRQWLVEIALAGFAQLDVATLAPILPTIAAIEQTDGLGRLAATVTGFAHELLDHAPTSALAELPRRRWADLWARCLLGTVVLPETPGTRTVDGRLFVLGADVRHHERLVSVVVHGVFEGGGARSFVRTTLSSWKVNAISGPDVWNLLRSRAPELFAALAAPAVLTLSGACLSSTGELSLGKVQSTSTFDPFALDFSGVILPSPAPRDRHPILIAIPAKDPGLPLDLSRSGPLLDLADEVADAASVIGLARWDESWRFQPLLVKTKKGKLVGASVTLALADKVKADARTVLAERASKLLRA